MLLIIILGILAAIVGVACGMQLQKRHFQQEIQNAKATAEKLLNNANEDAKKQSAKIIADGKQQTIDYQDSIEEELDSYQADNVTRQTRIQQRETGLKQTESRLDQLHSKLADESHEINQQKAEIEQLHHTANDLSQERLKTLQERGSISLAEAKQQILDELKTALKREKDIELKYQDDEAQVNAPKMAKILADDAIQRGPVDMPREHIEHSVQINDNNV
ncbi:Rnase Y domain-containing protein [Lentilactobacillus buchneri]|nr:Rnase Y domain-containing protein [Lentilactobacillus sp. Egmn17]